MSDFRSSTIAPLYHSSTYSNYCMNDSSGGTQHRNISRTWMTTRIDSKTSGTGFKTIGTAWKGTGIAWKNAAVLVLGKLVYYYI